MFSFYGYSDEVRDLMKTLSHKTRAYYINALGIKGFVKISIFEVIRRFDENEAIKKVSKY